MRRFLVPALLGILLLVAAVWGGRCWQASRDVRAGEDAVAKADAAADSARRVSDSTIAAVTERRRIETIARGLAEAEAERWRRAAAGHARQDRQADAALVLVRTAADSLPIVVGQRDDARAAYSAELKSGDSVRAVVVSLRADSVQADSILRVTKAGHVKALEAMRADLKVMAVRLEKATLSKKFLGFLPPLVCAVGYGGQLSTTQPIQATHGAQVTCGFRLAGT